MPVTITDDPTTFPAVTAPSSSDTVDVAGLQATAQELANRTAALKARVDLVAPGTGASPGGVRVLFHVASESALRALVSVPDRSVCLWDTYGLLQFIAGDVTDGDPYHFVADDSAGSWWLLPLGVLDIPLGLATLDAASRVAAAKVRNGIISSSSAKIGTVGTTIASTSSTSYVDITGVTLAVTGASVGDKLVCHGAVTISSSTSGGQCALAVTDPTPTTTLIQEAPFIAGSYGMMHFTGVYTVLAAGTQTVKLRYLSSSGAGSQTALGHAGLSALLIRP